MNYLIKNKPTDTQLKDLLNVYLESHNIQIHKLCRSKSQHGFNTVYKLNFSSKFNLEISHDVNMVIDNEYLDDGSIIPVLGSQLLLKISNPITEHRIGTFQLTKEFLEKYYILLLRDVFSKFIPFNTNYLYDRKIFEYNGYSEIFNPVDPGACAPMYVMIESGDITNPQLILVNKNKYECAKKIEKYC